MRFGLDTTMPRNELGSNCPSQIKLEMVSIKVVQTDCEFYLLSLCSNPKTIKIYSRLPACVPVCPLDNDSELKPTCKIMGVRYPIFLYWRSVYKIQEIKTPRFFTILDTPNALEDPRMIWIMIQRRCFLLHLWTSSLWQEKRCCRAGSAVAKVPKKVDDPGGRRTCEGVSMLWPDAKSQQLRDIG